MGPYQEAALLPAPDRIPARGPRRPAARAGLRLWQRNGCVAVHDPGRLEYFGVDFHAPFLAFAQAHFGSPHAHFLDALPPGQEFDLILYSDVLEHLEQPGRLLREHRTHLVPGGWISLSVPNGIGPFEIESWIYRRLGGEAVRSAVLAMAAYLKRTFAALRAAAPAVPYNRESGHLQFFTAGALDRLLSECGFATIGKAQGAFLGGVFSARILNRSAALIRWNAALGSLLPPWAVSS